MLKTLRQRPETVFALVLLWKAALLLFTAQPVPANDSFFYDGAVVNLLVQGQYCNPAIANALPISGNEVFSAYPPLYHVTLLGWMKIFGTSVLSAMWLHYVLFVLYAVLLLVTLRALCVPIWAMHFAGLFLLGLTFHDRPDSLAQALGMAAVGASVRAFRPSVVNASLPAFSRPRMRDEDASKSQSPAKTWVWLAAICVMLCLCTSLQIGGIYFLLIWLGMLLSAGRLKASPPLPGLIAMTLVPAALVLCVKLLWPHLWAGFLEHAQQTPTLTAWRLPDTNEFLKVLRAAPGVLLALGLLPFLFRRGTPAPSRTLVAPQLPILLSAGAAAAVVLGLALSFFAANLVLIAAYLQPLIVGVFLAVRNETGTPPWRMVGVKALFGFAVLLASIRALGLSTVGVVCAQDVNQSQALALVAREIASAPTNAPCALSSAYLYDAWPETRRLKLLHSDWLGPAVKRQPNAEVDALCAVKPSRLVLTQFDYYRRYVRVLAQLQSTTLGVGVTVENLARVPPPDASPRWQRVVQHVSWAPVIVRLNWADQGADSPF